MANYLMIQMIQTIPILILRMSAPPRFLTFAQYLLLGSRFLAVVARSKDCRCQNHSLDLRSRLEL